MNFDGKYTTFCATLDCGGQFEDVVTEGADPLDYEHQVSVMTDIYRLFDRDGYFVEIEEYYG